MSILLNFSKLDAFINGSNLQDCSEISYCALVTVAKKCKSDEKRKEGARARAFHSQMYIEICCMTSIHSAVCICFINST